MFKIDFNFKSFISNLSQEALEQFAKDCGTTVEYICRHLIYKNKIPRVETIEAIVIAGKGQFTKSEYIDWLYDLNVA